LTGVTRYVYEFQEGSGEMRDLLGGKGANLAEMAQVLGADRVPPGFVITTEACVAYMGPGEFPEGLAEQVGEALGRLEERAEKRLGDSEDPVLVSVRSGAPVSMPGMLETVLNVGLNDASVEGLAARTANPRFAWDAYRRLIQMFGDVVRGVPGDEFEAALREARVERGVEEDAGLDADDLRSLAGRFKQIFAAGTGEAFPEDPRRQLSEAIRAVFESWNSPRASDYRRISNIPDDLGTAVTVQQMAFGNKGASSGSGVAFSRDEIRGTPQPSGDFLPNAQGEDVVAGIRNPLDLSALAETMPQVHAELLGILSRLERHFRDMQDVEFTVEEGRLFILQTRSAKRPARAAVRFAHDAASEELLTREEALATIDAGALEALLHPVFDPDEPYDVLARGVAASPGAAKGAIVFSPEEAVRRGGEGEDVILVRPFTGADDVAGFHAARGILTSEGGKASHAALVARGMGRPCVAGAADVVIDLDRNVARVGTSELTEGAAIAIDGSSGTVTTDDVALITPEIGDDFRQVLRWADELRRLGVRANADTPQDAERARSFGAEGIGLCRTEHMFFGEDRDLLVKDMFIAAEHWRRSRLRAHTATGEAELNAAERNLSAALVRLRELQRRDFEGIFRAMTGLPVVIRLLDPPLHEFLPVEHFESELQRLLEDAGKTTEADRAGERLAIARELQEVNPMLGLRGARLGLLFPPVYEMQVGAIFEAALAVASEGEPPQIEVMLPLVAYESELAELRGCAVEAAESALRGAQRSLEYRVGTMIELPRACLVAARLAAHADFISFGTNDLTQTTSGLSRDDVERGFLPEYVQRRLIDRSPFETLDVEAVGELIRIAVTRAREVAPSIGLGVCGEHGGDRDSIEFFEDVGLEYVSCSPYRVPIARVAAAQAALRRSASDRRAVPTIGGRRAQ
jgi:pyruvate,orthophosphate dikinase